MSLLTLVRHQPSGEVYVIRQSPAGHCTEITGPYYQLDYQTDDGVWICGALRADHRANLGQVDQDEQAQGVMWADGEQWLNLAELEGQP